MNQPRFFCALRRSEIPEKGVAGMAEPITSRQIETIQQLAEQLAFGTITLTFQNGKLIQIEKSEKIRVDKEK